MTDGVEHGCPDLEFLGLVMTAAGRTVPAARLLKPAPTSLSEQAAAKPAGQATPVSRQCGGEFAPLILVLFGPSGSHD